MSGIILVAVLRVLVCMVCVISAYGLLREGKDGWGWFLFIGLIIGAFSLTGDSDEQSMFSNDEHDVAYTSRGYVH